MATCNDNYLLLYREFFEKFAASINPHDQLPVKIASYKLNNDEIAGVAADWTLQYLNQQHCPASLLATLTRIVVDEIKHTCKSQHQTFGYNTDLNVYEPLKLMKAVMAKVNEVCLRYLDNSELYNLWTYSPLQNPYNLPIVSSFAIKNTRRQMEDRHVYIHDLNTVFGVEDPNGPSSYYAIFDGHAGIEAAVYSSVHLHQYLAESIYYPLQPERALREAFVRTDAAFIDKAQKESLNCGTTAVCALLRPKQHKLYIAWVGDSMALIANHGSILQVVQPHRPSRMDERERITDMGGHVSVWTGGIWRVDGTLAISRAIGDASYKPYVTGDPDIVALPLNGGEDFLILATDGLWDCVCEDEASAFVYRQIFDNPDDTALISKNLVQLAKDQGSHDNISIIVVFLRDPHQIASTPLPQNITTGGTWHTTDNLQQTPDNTNRNGSENTLLVDTKECIDNKMDLELEQTLDNSNKNAFSLINNSNQKQNATDHLLLVDRIVSGDETFNNKQQTNGTAANNGDDESPSNEENLYYDNAQLANVASSPPTNGKRSADEFEDEDEEDEDEEDHSDDFGPETDVDAIDHHVAAMSPSLTAAKEISDGNVNNNPFTDEKLRHTYESDQEDDDDEDDEDELLSDELMEQRKSTTPIHQQQSDNLYHGNFNKDDDSNLDSSAKNINVHHEDGEMPTTEFDTVVDVTRSAPVENVTESGGEESDDEDEWNYYRGGKNNQTEDPQLVTAKENEEDKQIEDPELVTAEEDDEDNMSQLNPDAAEFVPISSARSTPLSPPMCENVRQDDQLIAQSPQKPTPMEQTIPNPIDFLSELRERPGHLDDDDFINMESKIKDDKIESHQIDESSSTQALENLLNGKNMDELEMMSGCLSGEGVQENISLGNEFDNKLIDVEKDVKLEVTENLVQIRESEFSTNPFDLNSVQMIPDNVDEFIGETGDDKANVDAVIDEVEALVEQEIKLMGVTKEQQPSNDTIDEEDVVAEQKVKSMNIEEKEQESPVDDKLNDFDVSTQDSKSPVPDNDAVLHQNTFESKDTAISQNDNIIGSENPFLAEMTEIKKDTDLSSIEATFEIIEPTDEFGLSVPSVTDNNSNESSDLSPAAAFDTTAHDLKSSPQTLSPVPDSTSPLPDQVSQPDSTAPLQDNMSQPDSTSPLPDQMSHPDSVSPLPEHISHPYSVSPLPEHTSHPDSVSPLPEHISHPDSVSPLPEHISQPDSVSPLPEHTSQLDSVSPLPEHISHPDSVSPLPEHISQPDSVSPLPEHISHPDSVSPLPEHISHPDSVSPLPEHTSHPDSVSPLPEHISHPDSVSPLPEHISQPDSTSPIQDYLSQPDTVSPVPEHVSQPSAVSPLPESKVELSDDSTAAVINENEYPQIPLTTEQTSASPIEQNELISVDSEQTPENDSVSKQIYSESTMEPFEHSTVDHKIENELIFESNEESVEKLECSLKAKESELIDDIIEQSTLEPEILDVQKDTPVFETDVDEFERLETSELCHQEISSPLSEKVPSPCFEKVGSPIETNSECANEKNLTDFVETNQVSIDTTVAESNLNSFLSRSPIAETPISPLQRTEDEQNKIEDITQQIEEVEQNEIKSTETPPPTPSIVVTESSLATPKPEPNQLVEAVEKLTEISNEASIKESTTQSIPPTPETVKKTKVATPSAASRTSTTPKPSSPSKSITAPSKRPTPITSRVISKTSTTTTTSPKPPVSSRLSSKPLTPTKTSTTPVLSAKKPPVSSAEVKPAIKSTLTSKRVSTTSTTATGLKATTDKNKLNQTPSPRPLTSVRKSTTIPSTRSPLTKDLTNEKSKPTNLSTKSTTSNGLSNKLSSSIAKSTTTTSRLTTTSTARPKSAPTTTLSSITARPRPTTITRKTLSSDATKSPSLTEKQLKETANKQLSVSRKSATPPTRTNLSTVKSRIGTTSNVTSRKTTPPIKSTRLTSTTTTTTAASLMKPKKPTVTTTTRTTITTKSAAVKTSAEQNQTVSLIQELTNVSVVSSNNETQLLVKDESPNTETEPHAPQHLDNNLVSVE